jgi:acyl carrier protein
MSIKETVVAQLQQIARASTKTLPPLTDDLILVDSGLDSLMMAVLVTRLEDTLGVDPFTDFQITSPPVTFGEFVRLYENAAQPS